MFIEFLNIFKLIKIKLNSYMTSNSDNTNFLIDTSENKLKKVIYDFNNVYVGLINIYKLLFIKLLYVRNYFSHNSKKIEIFQNKSDL